MNYAPFEDRWELLHHYEHIYSFRDYHLAEYGIWVKEKETNVYYMVTELRNEGVVVGDKKLRIQGTTVVNDTTSWPELYENYVFLDNSPCGKKV